MVIGIVWSSPNTNGLTAQCKNKAVEGVVAAGQECVEIQLNAYDIQRCQVCDSGKGVCARGMCSIQDDFMDLYLKLKDMSAIVWITPVYWHEMSEALSAFIARIRRNDVLVNHYLEGKRCIIVACAGKSGNGALRTASNLEYIMGQMKMLSRDCIPITPFNKVYALDKVKDAAMALCQEIQEKQGGKEGPSAKYKHT